MVLGRLYGNAITAARVPSNSVARAEHRQFTRDFA